MMSVQLGGGDARQLEHATLASLCGYILVALAQALAGVGELVWENQTIRAIFLSLSTRRGVTVSGPVCDVDGMERVALYTAERSAPVLSWSGRSCDAAWRRLPRQCNCSAPLNKQRTLSRICRNRVRPSCHHEYRRGASPFAHYLRRSSLRAPAVQLIALGTHL